MKKKFCTKERKYRNWFANFCCFIIVIVLVQEEPGILEGMPINKCKVFSKSM